MIFYRISPRQLGPRVEGPFGSYGGGRALHDLQLGGLVATDIAALMLHTYAGVDTFLFLVFA